MKRLAEAVGEAPEKYFHHVPVAKLDSDIVEAKADLWQTARAIRESERSDTWTRNPDSCVSLYGSVCPFLPVCTRRASLGDSTLYRKAEVAHEELKTG